MDKMTYLPSPRLLNDGANMRYQLKQVNGKNDDMFLFRRQNLESNCQNHPEERDCRIGAPNISNKTRIP